MSLTTERREDLHATAHHNEDSPTLTHTQADSKGIPTNPPPSTLPNLQSLLCLLHAGMGTELLRSDQVSQLLFTR